MSINNILYEINFHLYIVSRQPQAVWQTISENLTYFENSNKNKFEKKKKNACNIYFLSILLIIYSKIVSENSFVNIYKEKKYKNKNKNL